MDPLCRSLERNPVIAAVKTEADVNKALASPVETLFLLGGNICDLGHMIAQTREQGKLMYVHIDLVEGIGNDYYALKYLSETLRPDGVITTKSRFVKYAAEFDIYLIQRLFMLDSMSLETGLKSLTQSNTSPDAVEILPGILPEIIATFARQIKIPIIAGGLLTTKKDAITSLGKGARGVSTSNQALWEM